MRNIRARVTMAMVALMLLAVVPPAGAQTGFVGQKVTGTLTAVNSAVTIQIPYDVGALGFQITGTSTQTVQFEATVDGVTWVSLPVVPQTTAALRVISATAVGVFQANVAGLKAARVRTSGYTSGTFTVTAVRSSAHGPAGQFQ